jgi:hypothetical protein
VAVPFSAKLAAAAEGMECASFCAVTMTVREGGGVPVLRHADSLPSAAPETRSRSPSPSRSRKAGLLTIPA